MSQLLTAEVNKIIEKWYKALSFPAAYDEHFYHALQEYEIPADTNIENYDIHCEDGLRNLLSFLYMCESLEHKYAAHGIDRTVLLDTLYDIVIFTNVWSELKPPLYLGQLNWLIRHLTMRIFRLGRLQFEMSKTKDGTPILDIHIPAIGKMTRDACLESIDRAQVFFAKHFPEHEWAHFSCHSWLLDTTLDAYLPQNSNIRNFREMFTLQESNPSFTMLRYIFRWDTTKENLASVVPCNAFGEKIKNAVLGGVQFYETKGIIEK